VGRSGVFDIPDLRGIEVLRSIKGDQKGVKWGLLDKGVWGRGHFKMAPEEYILAYWGYMPKSRNPIHVEIVVNAIGISGIRILSLFDT
jgi:hypothetical protein